MNLSDYITPVSVDHAGAYPGKKLGDIFSVAHHGKLYVASVVGEAHELPNGSVLCNIRFQQVEGPVTFSQRYF